MKVTLISKTEPTSELRENGIDSLGQLIAHAARVSNPKNQYNTKTSAKLLQYLMREGHWSPFEMASMCLEIQTTRDIARQIIRHRSFSFQEFSQRYAEVQEPPMFKEARGQDLKNRQNSVRLEDGLIHEEWRAKQESVFWAADTAYKWALRNGLAKEQARAVLPEGITPSTIYMNGTIRSWIHYAELRGGHGTQQEHILIAQEVSKILDEHVWTE